MEHQYWLQRWQTNNTKFNQKKVNPLLIKFFNEFDIKQSRKVFVPLCGKSIDMLWFAQQGHSVMGVELSQIACETFFNENNLPYVKQSLGSYVSYSNENITLLAGDFNQLTPEIVGKIDLIYDRAALVALPPTMRKNYVSKLTELSDINTKIFLISFVYEQSQMQGPPFSVPLETVQILFEDSFNIEVLYREKAEKLSQHLVEKGLKKADELIVKLERN